MKIIVLKKNQHKKTPKIVVFETVQFSVRASNEA